VLAEVVVGAEPLVYSEITGEIQDRLSELQRASTLPVVG